MKITRIDAFQVRWTPGEKPTQHSAFVRIFTDDGIDGIGEASPMLGGVASLGMIRHDEIFFQLPGESPATSSSRKRGPSDVQNKDAGSPLSRE